MAILGDLDGCHSNNFLLRLLKPLQRPFSERIQDNQLGATTGGIVQLGHHARAVRARVLPDNEDQVGMIEVFKRTRTLANSDRRRQPLTSRFVAII